MWVISMNYEMKAIARIHTEFPDKFGIPRQSGLVEELRGEIIFEPEYRRAEALLGIGEYSHLWLLWVFSEAKRSSHRNQDSVDGWSPYVYPPRLGGQEKRGVFATRSPFRVNPIGLSCVRLIEVVRDGADAPRLIVAGADLLDGTPILDIKPYLPYADAHPEARGSFGQAHSADRIEVIFPPELLERLPEKHRAAAVAVLAQDPRAAYQKQPDYVYGMTFAGYDIRFTVRDGVLRVCDVVPATEGWTRVK